MLIEKDDNGTIIKINLGGGFLNIKQAFVFSVTEGTRRRDEVVGKICFEFGKYDSPQSKRLKETILYYMDIEEAAYLAELMKSGKIFNLCAKAKEKNQYGSGYESLAGVHTSKQLKIQQADEQKYFIKALEGPGEKAANGLMVPKYNDQTAEKKIAISVNCAQIMKIGIALQRAIAIYDHLLSRGLHAVIEYAEQMKYKGTQQASGYAYNSSPAPFNLEDIY